MFLPPTPKNKTRPTIYNDLYVCRGKRKPLRSGYWSSESAPPEITDFREATSQKPSKLVIP